MMCLYFFHQFGGATMQKIFCDNGVSQASHPTNLTSTNRVGTGVLDRPEKQCLQQKSIMPVGEPFRLPRVFYQFPTGRATRPLRYRLSFARRGTYYVPLRFSTIACVCW